MSIKNDIWAQELWTQQEVADYFRVVPGTIKNWRSRGLLDYWQPPGSKRVFYFRDDVKSFRDKNKKSSNGNKGGGKQHSLKNKEKPAIPTKVQWRV